MQTEWLDKLSGNGQERQLRALESCNALSSRFGLTLTPRQMRSLLQQRETVLTENGRVEFGGGVLEKLVYAFCDSPYIQRDDYFDTLAALQEAFYYFKGEAMEQLPDDELIADMKTVFDGAAQGSVDYLTQTSLERLCRTARCGGEWDGEADGPVFMPEEE